VVKNGAASKAIVPMSNIADGSNGADGLAAFATPRRLNLRHPRRDMAVAVAIVGIWFKDTTLGGN